MHTAQHRKEGGNGPKVYQGARERSTEIFKLLQIIHTKNDSQVTNLDYYIETNG